MNATLRTLSCGGESRQDFTSLTPGSSGRHGLELPSRARTSRAGPPESGRGRKARLSVPVTVAATRIERPMVPAGEAPSRLFGTSAPVSGWNTSRSSPDGSKRVIRRSPASSAQIVSDHTPTRTRLRNSPGPSPAFPSVPRYVPEPSNRRIPGLSRSTTRISLPGPAATSRTKLRKTESPVASRLRSSSRNRGGSPAERSASRAAGTSQARRNRKSRRGIGDGPPTAGDREDMGARAPIFTDPPGAGSGLVRFSSCCASRRDARGRPEGELRGQAPAPSSPTLLPQLHGEQRPVGCAHPSKIPIPSALLELHPLVEGPRRRDPRANRMRCRQATLPSATPPRARPRRPRRSGAVGPGPAPRRP